MASEKKETELESTRLASGEADAALEYLNHEGSAVMSEIDEKALVKKIDWRIVPLMWACKSVLQLERPLLFV